MLRPAGHTEAKYRIVAYCVVLSVGFAGGMMPPGVAGQGSTAASGSGLELESIDRTVDPCSDFYQFACGGWITKHPVPPGLAGIGRGRELRTRTYDLLTTILTGTAADPERQKAIRYYKACADEVAIEAQGLKPIQSALSRIRAVRTAGDLSQVLAYVHSVAFIFGAGTQLPYRAFFDFRAHYAIPTQSAALTPSGMALPYRQLYLAADARSSALRSAYVAHVRQIFTLLGASSEEATTAAQAVLAIETALARVSLDPLQLRAAETERMSLDDLQLLTPNFNWREYLQAASTSSPRITEVVAPSYMRTVDDIITKSSIEDLKSYLQWQLVHASVVMMPKVFREADFELFGRTLRGQMQPPARSEVCVVETDELLGGVVGKAFVEKAFSPRSRAEILAIVSRLQTVMEDVISDASWLSDVTKSAARAKLALLTVRMGYPDRWPDYSAVDVRADDALGNRQRALAFERAIDLQKIGRQPGPEEWPRVSVAMGEAGYRAERNMILFPAGFLQRPLYDATRDTAVNYGAAGAMIGHEITHAFDDIGRRLDGTGRWRDWWTPADAKSFQDRAMCLLDQYSGYRVAGNASVDGRLTLGENIADHGGIRLALLAYLAGPGADSTAALDGFTPVQRVFLGWAQAWCQNVRPEAERLGVSTDPHAPTRYRVNGPLANMPEFHAAFSCKPAAPMVRTQMCRVW